MDNKKSNTCNIKLDKDNFKKDRTVCKSYYKKRKEKTTIRP